MGLGDDEDSQIDLPARVVGDLQRVVAGAASIDPGAIERRTAACLATGRFAFERDAGVSTRLAGTEKREIDVRSRSRVGQQNPDFLERVVHRDRVVLSGGGYADRYRLAGRDDLIRHLSGCGQECLLYVGQGRRRMVELPAGSRSQPVQRGGGCARAIAEGDDRNVRGIVGRDDIRLGQNGIVVFPVRKNVDHSFLISRRIDNLAMAEAKTVEERRGSEGENAAHRRLGPGLDSRIRIGNGGDGEIVRDIARERGNADRRASRRQRVDQQACSRLGPRYFRALHGSGTVDQDVESEVPRLPDDIETALTTAFVVVNRKVAILWRFDARQIRIASPFVE